MNRPIAERLARLMFAPAGLAPSVYRDYLIGVTFVPSAILAVAFATGRGVHSLGFMVTAAIALVGFVLANRKRVLFVGVLALCTIRFAFASIVKQDPLAILATVISGGLLWLLVITADDSSYWND